MNAAAKPDMNVKQVVPFLRISDMERSVRFYIDGLGFVMRNKWVVDEQLRWCWLELGGAALMLQTYVKDGSNAPVGKLGRGVSLAFQCEDAVKLYRDFISRGLEASEPQVGNSMWATGLSDPDGYRLEFESPTDVREETKLSELKSRTTFHTK
jgi:catechol 2,3-dioxygenase-like lactoylglutathione lyase family enzyme